MVVPYSFATQMSTLTSSPGDTGKLGISHQLHGRLSIHIK